MKNPYLLLTPGPLSTTAAVKEVMLQDWCTWDEEYKQIVQGIRQQCLALAGAASERYTTVLLQGSGTFGVEAVLGSVIPHDGKLAILVNGAYGQRMEQICTMLKLSYTTLEFASDELVNAERLDQLLQDQPEITHVAMVHCETTTGILNPLADVMHVIHKHRRVSIIDAMSSFGGIPIDVEKLSIDFLISSSNKCIQGVPGFCFVIGKREQLQLCKGRARSLSLDLYDQWQVMEQTGGKWRYTSPTHVVRAFAQALKELEEEGGIPARHARYQRNHERLVAGMKEVGFEPYLPEELQSPIITTFLYPADYAFSFEEFYTALKKAGFVIYPGKLTDVNVFRIANIGDIHVSDIERLIEQIKLYVKEKRA